MSPNSRAKKIAIITGASSGLGAEFARQLDREGLDEIWLVARRKKNLDELAKNLKTRSVALKYDLKESKNLDAFHGKLDKERPEIAFLVNNAGIGAVGPVASSTHDQVLGMIDLNIRALVSVTMSAIPYMGTGSVMIQVASSAGFAPLANFAVYAATKSFVIHFSNAISEELKEKKINVTAVCPGPVRTEFFDASGISNVPRFLYEAPDVVKYAIKHGKKGKLLSVHGLWIKAYGVIAPFLPRKLILKVSKKIKG